MIPVVDNAGAIHANTLGLGKLREIVTCVVHEELNGDYSIEFEYPITGWAYNELLGDSVIRISPSEKLLYNGDYLSPASFDIVKHTKPISGLVKFFGQHVSRRLSGVVTYANTVTGYSRSGDTYLGELDNMFSRCKPSYSTQGYTYPDINGLRTAQNYPTDMTAVVGSVSLTRPKSALSTLVGDEESLVSVLGGDVFFADNGYDLYVYYDAHRGKDSGASIRFGVNMLDIEQEKDMTGAYNAVVPFWDDGNGNITYVSGYIVQPTTPITPIIAVPLDLSNDFDTQPTDAQMVTLARQHLDTKTPWTGSETIKVDFINGVEIDPHAPDIQLGDTVHVYWGDADIATDLRVVAYDYDVLAERYISLELGTPQTQYVAVTGESYAGASGGGSGGGGGALAAYPVGSIYMSVNSTYPGTLFGGEWERITGRFLLAATDGGSSGASQAAGRTGGEATHTLTTNEMPKHTHGSKSLSGSFNLRRYGTSGTGTDIPVGGEEGIVDRSQYTWSGSHGVINAASRSQNNSIADKITVNATHEHTSVGGGAAHNNMPPYLAVYVWKRTA